MNFGPNLIGWEDLLKRTVKVLEALPAELRRMADAMELRNELLDQQLRSSGKRPPPRA